MTYNLTYDDSILESHYSKTCEASSYKEELSATSKPDSQINTTEELSACLARLNANRRKVGAGDGNTYVVSSNTPDAIALANKLHDAWESVCNALEQSDVSYDNLSAERDKLKAENERLKALLVECEGALSEGTHYATLAEGYQDESDFPEQARAMLTKLHASGIGKL